MPKPTLEFTAVEDFPLRLLDDEPSSMSIRTLSHDPETGDKTIILYHPPGQEWGGAGGKDSSAVHDYWEVC